MTSPTLPPQHDSFATRSAHVHEAPVSCPHACATAVPMQARPAGSSTPATVALRVSAAVAGHDKDINTIAVAPNDSLIATGACSQGGPCACLPYFLGPLREGGRVLLEARRLCSLASRM